VSQSISVMMKTGEMASDTASSHQSHCM